MNPRAVQEAMKKMGVKQEEIPAEKVVVYSEGKMLVIQNPHVVKVVMMGEESYQITGILHGSKFLSPSARMILRPFKRVLVVRERKLRCLKRVEGRSCWCYRKGV